jgi:hypothetical protein
MKSMLAISKMFQFSSPIEIVLIPTYRVTRSTLRIRARIPKARELLEEATALMKKEAWTN